MQKGKISKILDSIVVRTAFGRLKAGERKSYKDYLFLEILESDGSIVRKLFGSRLQDWQLFQLRLRVQQLIGSSSAIETLSPEEFYRQYLAELSQKHAPEQITTLHATLDIAEDSATALSKVMALFDVSIADLRGELLRHVLLGQPDALAQSDLQNEQIKGLMPQRQSKLAQRLSPKHPLAKFGRNLTEAATNGEIDPVIGRSKEIDRVIEILSRRKKNNPILIGEAGVGKSAVVEGLALRIVSGDVPYTIANKVLFSLDISSLVAGTKFRGEFEERLQQLISALSAAKDTIIFIDEIHTIVGAGATQGSLDTANILKPALARGELQVIGATTLDEYRNDIESDAALERRFQRVLVEPTTESQTLEILRNIAPSYEQHHNVKYSEEALQAAVTLSARYITDRHFPDKAIDILDEVGARAHLSAAVQPDDIRELEESLVAVKQERNSSLEALAYERAADARLLEVSLHAKLNEREREWRQRVQQSPILVGVEHVEAVITSITGVPAERVSAGELERLRGVEEHLSSRVIGQREAVEKLSRSIYRSRAGLKESRRPIGVFLFVGPTGVGKTLLAKELSRWMFDDRRGLIRIDMSEYAEKHNVSRLIGSPPGYVGYDEGGHLSEAVRRQPYSVVLLDEIEKAHPEVFNSMLQIFDEGHLTDGAGRKVDFSNTIIIMTSNVGSRVVAKRRKLVGYSTQVKEHIAQQAPKVEYRSALERTFAPEFLNRIDDIVLFRSLTLDDVKEIIALELNDLKTRLQRLGYTLRITESAKQTLAQIGYSANYGARALKRTLNDKIEVPLSQLIIDGELSHGNTIVVEKAKSLADVKLRAYA
ncbi:MAG: ATP-dependent Clp protease ATP-binding subunit [Rikenellaceae bacterium]